MRNPITDIIAEKGWAVADGATGSNFFGRGLEAGYPPDLWCIEKPGTDGSICGLRPRCQGHHYRRLLRHDA